jgi:signal transduction protein with GAF and PtsI domain
MINVFLERLETMVPYSTCAVTLVDSDSGEFLVRNARGEHGEILMGRRIAPGEGITGWVLANQKPFFNTDPRLDFSLEVAEKFKSYRTIAAFPVIKDKQLHGALTLYSAALAEYGKDQQKLIREAAALLADKLSATAIDAGVKDVQAEKPTEAATVNSLEAKAETSVLRSEMTH